VQLKKLREAAGFTQEELATIAGLSVHAVSALERGSGSGPRLTPSGRSRLRSILTAATRDQLLTTARTPAHDRRGDDAIGVSLPLALTRLVGRDEDVKALRQWLADSSARLITLTGPGGAGKTRLALEVARQITSDGAARVLFVPLAAIRDAAFVARRLPRLSGCWTSPPSTWRAGPGRRATGRRPGSSSTISSRSSTPGRSSPNCCRRWPLFESW
jgi:transcriptional regulator with XRE-family HTH domain